MGQPAARQSDPVTGTDVHIVLTPSPGGPVPTPVPLPFSGQVVSGTSTDVLVNGRPAAVAGSTAQNLPRHLPPPGTSFSRPPTNSGLVLSARPRSWSTARRWPGSATPCSPATTRSTRRRAPSPPARPTSWSGEAA